MPCEDTLIDIGVTEVAGKTISPALKARIGRLNVVIGENGSGKSKSTRASELGRHRRLQFRDAAVLKCLRKQILALFAQDGVVQQARTR